MRVPFNDLYSQNLEVLPDALVKFKTSIENSEFILGKAVEDFESNFANWGNFKFVVGVGNGSDAIRLALEGMGVTVKDKVLLAVNTYFAAAAAIAHLGAEPIFVDVDIDSRFPSISNFNSIDADNIKVFIRSHLFGGADISELPSNLNLVPQLHDASQAHGTTVEGKKIGSIGTSTFSFYPGKNLGAFGDAGAVVTDSETIFSIVKKLRNQGTNLDKYTHEELGYNSRLDALQARILSLKLVKLDQENQKRQTVVEWYLSNLYRSDNRILFFNYPPKVKPAHHLFQIRIQNVDIKDFIHFLETRGVSAGRHYPIPLHLQPALKYLGYKKGDFPNAEKLAAETLSLPMYPNLSKDKIDFICEQVHTYLEVQ
jgi:dTDP-4-amino-4,6-dideoxygalactose transaminase